MAARLTETFDSGVDGGAVSAGGNIATVSGSPTYTSDAKHGALALSGAGATTAAIRITLGANPASHSGSVYIKPSGVNSTAVARVVQFDTAAGTGLGSIRFHNDGLIDIAAGSTRQDSSNFSWTDAQWHRIDWQCDASGGSCVITARLFAPGDVEGSTPTDTITGTINAGTLGRWQFGCLGGVAGTTIKSDTIRIADGAEWLGPFVAAAGTVTHAWVGAPTTAGFRVRALLNGATSVRLGVSTDSGLASPTYETAQTPDGNGYVDFTVTGLTANTQYYYQFEDTPDGGSPTLIGNIGRAKTLPSGASNFTFAFGSCIGNDTTDGVALDDVRTWNPHFLIQMGDFHYQDPTSSTASVHRGLWEDQIQGAEGLAQLLAEVPTLYARSDHDAGPGDNGDQGAEAPASISAYQDIVPSYTLADVRSPKHGVYQAWTCGRVRFIVLDIRNTDRSTGADAQSSSKTMLGATQLAWLFDELDRSEPVKVICSDVPWLGTAQINTSDDHDKWWAYDDERTAIGDYISTNGKNVVMLTGDNHFLGADDGSHNTWGGFHVWAAAPFANVGGGRFTAFYDSVYNTTISVDARQYGRVTVTDDGSTITLAYSGWDAITATEKISDSVMFEVSSDGNLEFSDGPSGGAFLWDGADAIPVSAVL